MSKAQRRTPLEQLRIDRDWTYSQLRDEIARVTGIERSEATWLRICQGSQQPRRTAVGALERFLAHAQQASR